MSLIFRDRIDAARRLIDRLRPFEGPTTVVLGIPRGAVPMAREIADALDTDVDVLLVHKVTWPHDPELAVAAVDDTGEVVRYESNVFTDEELEALAAPEVRRLEERRRALTGVRSRTDLRDRVVIIVDDGLATGATMLAGIRAVRRQGAAKVVVAAPVASPESVTLLAPEADELIILSVPRALRAVGTWYRDFRPVSDKEVLAALQGPVVAGERS